MDNIPSEVPSTISSSNIKSEVPSTNIPSGVPSTSNYTGTSYNENEDTETIEIHSKDSVNKDIGNIFKKVETYLSGVILIFLFIILPIGLIIKYEGYSYIIPYIRTNIFIYIRNLWIIMVIWVFLFPLKMIKVVKYLIQKVYLTITYIYNPLRERKTNNTYRKIKYSKVKKFYLNFSRFWFIIALMIYSILLIIIGIFTLLSFYFLGHMIGYMDSWWILK